MINSAGSKVRPSWRPWPDTRTRLASPISDWLITTGMGLLATCCPFFFTCTRCSPVSLGTNEIPTWPFRSRFSRQGSSLPEGGTTVAVNRLRSVSEMLMGMSAAEPTFRWDIRMESSPVTLAVKGLPGMCCSLYLTRML